MIIIWGSRLYGKVDEIPGLGYVATKFGHLWYFPLIPMGSYLVTEEQGGKWRGAAIPLNMKSVFIAWLRALLAVVGIASLFALFSSGSLAAGAVAGVAAFVVLGSYQLSPITSADYARACQLAGAIGVSAEGRVLIDLAYGRIDPRRAEAKLGELATRREQQQVERAAKAEARAQAQGQNRAWPAGNSALRAKAPRRRRRLAGS